MAKLTKEQLVLVEELRGQRASWGAIGKRFGLSAEVVRQAADPEYAERRRQQTNAARRALNRKCPTKGTRVENVVPEDDVRAARSWMKTPDTRDLTAVLLGDPYPGRSALEQKGAVQ